MTLYCLLLQILPKSLFAILCSDYFDTEIDESEQILNNEIAIWLSTLESMHPSVLRRIAFVKPDYDEILFNSLEYKHAKGEATLDDI
jgi:hypothetical protein